MEEIKRGQESVNSCRNLNAICFVFVVEASEPREF